MQHMPRDRAGKSNIPEVEMRDLSRSEIESLIDEWILNERDRRILKRRMIDGICYEPLAEEFDLSVQRVKSIVYKSKEKLFRHLD